MGNPALSGHSLVQVKTDVQNSNQTTAARRRETPHRGFILVGLLVVIAIIAIKPGWTMTKGVPLTQVSIFNSTAGGASGNRLNRPWLIDRILRKLLPLLMEFGLRGASLGAAPTTCSFDTPG